MKLYLKLLSGELITYEGDSILSKDLANAVYNYLSLDPQRYNVKLIIEESIQEGVVIPVWIEDIFLSESIPYQFSLEGTGEEVSWWISPPIGETEEYKTKLRTPVSDEEKSDMYYNLGNEREHFFLSHTHFREYITRKIDGISGSVWIKYYPRKELIQLTNAIDLCKERLNYVLNSYENIASGDMVEFYFYDYIVHNRSLERKTE